MDLGENEGYMTETEVMTFQKRTSKQTRQAILNAAFDEVYEKGFQGASLGTISKKAGVTKGALYHHFDSKLDLGYAVVDDVIRDMIRDNWVERLAGDTDPIQILQIMASDLTILYGLESSHLGCPMDNLAHEMSPLDEGFRSRINRLISEWHLILTYAIERGQKNGFVKMNVDAARVAGFIMACVQGTIGLMKNTLDQNLLIDCGQELLRYLDSLRIEQVETPVPITS